MKYSRSGFSLIEMLVVIAVIGILATTTVAVFTRFNQQQNITIASKNLRNDLAEAKSYAQSQVVDDCPSGILRGFQLDYRSPSTYALQVLCETGGTVNAIDVRAPKLLPTDATFTNDFGNIRFNSLLGTSTGGNITIRSNSVTQTITISVTTEGVIQ